MANIKKRKMKKLHRIQCDQIGRFLKVLGDKIYNKTTVATLRATLETIWLLFTPTSDRTEFELPIKNSLAIFVISLEC